MSPVKVVVVGLLACFAWIMPAAAQGADKPPAPKTIGVDFVYLGEAAQQPLRILGDKSKRQLTLLPNTALQFFSYAGSTPLVFYRETKMEVGTDGVGPVAKPVPLLSVDLPPGASRFLLLLSPSGNPQAPFNHVVIALNEAQWPSGSAMVWNTTADPAVCLLGNQKVELPAGVRRTVGMPVSKEPFSFMLGGLYKGKVQLLYSTAMNAPAGGRKLVIVHAAGTEAGLNAVIALDLPGDLQRIGPKGEWQDSLF